MELRALSDEDRLLWTVRRDPILFLWHCPAISTCGDGLEEAGGDLLSLSVVRIANWSTLGVLEAILYIVQ
jgi:hypothetical protein